MPEHKNIAPALAAAQQKMGKALKDSTNPHFNSKYADLASVIDACLQALNEQGIAVIQPLAENEFGRHVVTKFIHSSGETLDCPVPLIVGKNDMQGLGSAITYARRYGLMSLAGIAPEDDDGNAAAASPQSQNPTWAQTVIQDLPEDASEHDKARALTDALCAQWKRKKTETQLSNEWDRRVGLIDSFKDRFPQMHAEVIDAYEIQMMEVSQKEVA